MSEIKRCKRHGDVLFHYYPSSKKWRCKKCMGEAVSRRQRKMKATLIEENGGACRLCGYSKCHAALEFHHVNPAEKTMSMSMASTKALAKYQAEAKKCLLLCANCHREVEWGGREIPASISPL